MKKLLIVIIVGSFVTLGLSQDKNTVKKKPDSVPNGPKIEKVNPDSKNNQGNNQFRSSQTKTSAKSEPGKLSFTREVKSSKSKSVPASMTKNQPKRILKTDRSHQIGQKNERIHSQSKLSKRLSLGDVFAERIEIKKIEGHSPLSEEVLLKALNNSRRVKASKVKSD